MWAPLKRRKAPRGNPEAAASKRWSVSEASSSKSSRTNATIAESVSKEFESLAVHMPNVSDSDARALAVRMYYKYRRKGLMDHFFSSAATIQQGFFSCTFPQLNPSFYRSETYQKHLTHVCLGISGRHNHIPLDTSICSTFVGQFSCH